jgi:hypothetical protein
MRSVADEQGLTMHVCGLAAAGVMQRICEGTDIGTRLSAKP